MTRLAPFAVLAGVLVGSAVAQGRHVFVVDPTASSFAYAGVVTLAGVTAGVVGQPNTFDVTGELATDVTVTVGAITDGNLIEGNGAVVKVPALTAIVTNSSVAPPLATLHVTPIEVSFTSSASFAVDGAGSFSVTVAPATLVGEVTVTGLVNATVPLDAQLSFPTTASGMLAPSANGMDLVIPISTTFGFFDAGAGVSGILSIVGTIVAEDRSLAADVDMISLTTGGVQTMTLSAGTANTGLQYITLGTTSGAAPGFDANGVNIPLNADGWTIQTASAPNTFPLGGSLGVIDAVGNGTTTLTFPPLPIPILVGLQFHHAYAVLDGGGSVTFASNPVPMTFTP